jgi:hypothetical protein
MENKCGLISRQRTGRQLKVKSPKPFNSSIQTARVAGPGIALDSSLPLIAELALQYNKHARFARCVSKCAADLVLDYRNAFSA